MKNIKYLLLALSIIGFSACNTGDDLYTSPSKPLVASSATLLTALEVNTFMNYEGELNRIANVYSQHMAGVSGQFLDAQNYDLSESAFDNMWSGLYGTMQNAKILIDDYSENRPYYSGMAKVLFALNLGLTTDLWGDVPYSEAYQGASGNFTAKFDSQEDVLKSIQTMLDEAIVELSKSEGENVEIVGDDDLIFKGDANSWVRAAWMLKARYANRLSLKDPSGSATKVIEYLDNALAVPAVNPETDVDLVLNMEGIHSGSTPNQWGAFENERGGQLVANKTFVDVLKQRNDPRLEYYFSKYKAEDTDPGEYIGADIQSLVISTSASTVNTSGFFSVSKNFPLVTEYELYFLLAEAQSRLGQDAGGALNDAIKASVSYVTNGKFATTDQAVYSNPTISDIMTEKWIAFAGQMEAYSDYRRTSLPTLTPRSEAVGALRAYTPKRMPTPQAERLGNPNNAKVFELDVPVWWAKP